ILLVKPEVTILFRISPNCEARFWCKRLSSTQYSSTSLSAPKLRSLSKLAVLRFTHPNQVEKAMLWNLPPTGMNQLLSFIHGWQNKTARKPDPSSRKYNRSADLAPPCVRRLPLH